MGRVLTYMHKIYPRQCLPILNRSLLRPLPNIRSNGESEDRYCAWLEGEGAVVVCYYLRPC